MTLYPNNPFADGDDFTADLATLAFNQVFDGQTQYLGHRPKIADADLSDANNALKARYTALTDALKVTTTSGLVLAYNAGLLRILDGSTIQVNAGLITIPDNTSGFVYVNNNGTVQATNGTVPSHRMLLAFVTTSSGAVTYLFDMRALNIREILPRMDAVRIIGGVSTIAKVCTNNEVLDDGIYSWQEFTVPSGVTVFVSGFAQIYVAGNVNIAGTIIVSPVVSGASGFSTPLTNAAAIGGLSGQGMGGGSGSAAGGKKYGFGVSNVGSGGGLGYAIGATTATASVAFGAGGLGGGGLRIESSANISITGTITANGGNGGTGSIVLGQARITGSGGGSGGLVYLASLYTITVGATATISVNGGVGGNAVRALPSGDAGCQGGSGGAGGHIVCVSPSINTTGATLLINGGAMGTNLGATPADLGGGGGGGFGGNGGNQSAGSSGKITYRNFIPF